MRGAEEPIALGRAQTERRVVVTLDKDFGELAFPFACHAESDVILIRLDRKDPDNDNQVAIAALLSREHWAGNSAVIERDRIRIRLYEISTGSLRTNESVRARDRQSE